MFFSHQISEVWIKMYLSVIPLKKLNIMCVYIQVR